jgi:hypothetical protein
VIAKYLSSRVFPILAAKGSIARTAHPAFLMPSFFKENCCGIILVGLSKVYWPEVFLFPPVEVIKPGLRTHGIPEVPVSDLILARRMLAFAFAI